MLGLLPYSLGTVIPLVVVPKGLLQLVQGSLAGSNLCPTQSQLSRQVSYHAVLALVIPDGRNLVSK